MRGLARGNFGEFKRKTGLSASDERAIGGVGVGGLPQAGWRVWSGIIKWCRVLRDAIPPTPPGPEGSNGNGLVRAQ